MFTVKAIADLRRQINEERRMLFSVGDLATPVRPQESGIQGLRKGQKWVVIVVDERNEKMIVSLVGVSLNTNKLVLRVASAVVGDVFEKA